MAVATKKRRRRSKNTTFLVVERQIRCNGHLHKIGLNSKGQLHIPSHTKKELKGFIALGDLGNNPCKCAVIYDAWTRSDFTHDQIHNEMRREKFVYDKLANRLLKYKKRIRGQAADSIIAFGTKGTLKLGEQESYGRRPINFMAEYVTDTVYKTLLTRGYDKRIFTKGATAITMKYSINSYAVFDEIFSAPTSGWSSAYISPQIGGQSLLGCSVTADDKDTEIPWRIFIDNAEKQLLLSLIRHSQTLQLQAQQNEFAKLANEHCATDFQPLPYNAEVSGNSNKGTVDLTITHDDLTIQAAERLVDHYRKTEGKVKALLRYNSVRRELPFRFPSKPSQGVGALEARFEDDETKEHQNEDRPLVGETYKV